MRRSLGDSDSFTDLLEVLLRIAEGVEAIARIKEDKKTGKWRGDPATKKQKAFMTKYHIPFYDSITKGQASDLIDGYRANQKKEG